MFRPCNTSGSSETTTGLAIDMAEDQVHKQEFLLRNLLTNSVTLYPTRAQVVREINDITLKVSYQPDRWAADTQC